MYVAGTLPPDVASRTASSRSFIGRLRKSQAAVRSNMTTLLGMSGVGK